MAVDNIQILLIAHSTIALNGEVLRGLGLSSGQPFVTRESSEAYQTEQVYFVNAELSSITSADPYDEFARKITMELEVAAEWLKRISSEVFNGFRERGVQLDIIVSAWIEQDQFDLSLPAEFLSACGDHNLSIQIVTND